MRKIRRVRNGVFACGFALALPLACVSPVFGQPPAPGTENMAYHVPEIEGEWNKLRREVGALEFTQPRETIEQYQQFYEKSGLRSATTAVKIGTVIAQIYWQQLRDHGKAVEIYDWLVQKFSDLPQMGRLRRERDEIANLKFPKNLVDATGIRIAVPAPYAATAPIRLNHQLQPLPGIAVVDPIRAPSGMEMLADRGEVKLESRMDFALPTLFEVSPLAQREIPLIEQINLESANTHFLPESKPLNARHTTLLGYITLWKSGKLSWEKMVETAAFTAEDIKLLAASRKVVSMYSDGVVMREKFGRLIQTFPELTENWKALPVPAQIALGEAYTKQKNPLAETIFRSLLEQEVPYKAWWNKEHIMYRLAQYHAALGDYVKAAEVNLEIAAYTQHPAWHNDSFIVAARFYRRAGQEEKAAELYKRAAKGKHGWAAGVALFDQASILLGQGKHAEVRRLLSAPVTGPQSEQIQPVLHYALAAAYFKDDNWEEARKYAQKAVDSFSQLTNPVLNEGVEQKVSGAQYMLNFMKYWSKEPVISLPREVRLHERGQNETVPFIVRCVLHSYADIAISVVADTPGVKAWVAQAGRPASTGVFDSYARELVIQVDPALIKSSSTITLQISSPKHPEFKAPLPIHVVAG